MFTKYGNDSCEKKGFDENIFKISVLGNIVVRGYDVEHISAKGQINNLQDEAGHIKIEVYLRANLILRCHYAIM